MLSKSDNLLFDLQTRDDLANYLEISPVSLRYLLYKKRVNECYSINKIPKHNGKYRELSIPNPIIKSIQTKLLRRLENVYTPKQCVYGFTKGLSFVSNATPHVGKAWILNIDLKDFFDQINFGRVRGVFMAKPYCAGKEAATVMAQIACYKGKLPQGAPTSPIISNIVSSSLDSRLIAFAKKYKLLYTRYADDITFSSRYKNIPKAVAVVNGNEIDLGVELAKIIDESGFVVNKSKISLTFPHQRQEVTGLTVNNKVNIKREQLRKIRIMLYTTEKFGLFESAKKYINIHKSIYPKQYKMLSDSEKKPIIEKWYKLVLIGKINYVKMVRGEEDSFYNQFANQYNSILGEDYFKTKSIESRTDFSYLVHSCIYIVYSGDTADPRHYQGSAFLLRNYGILTNAHNLKEDWVYFEICDQAGNKIKQMCNGINDNIIINRDMDYAFIPFKKDMGWRLCKLPQYGTNQTVTKIGFPHYQDGDTPNIQPHCEITSHKQDKGGYYTLKGSILHGDSGGIITNSQNEAIGIIRVGSDAYIPSPDDSPPGFIPIDIVIEDIEKKLSECGKTKA